MNVIPETIVRNKLDIYFLIIWILSSFLASCRIYWPGFYTFHVHGIFIFCDRF